MNTTEPRYCICRQVAYGKMVGCDNDDCANEWFHFDCVNIRYKPKGKWYCQNCRSGSNQRKLNQKLAK